MAHIFRIYDQGADAIVRLVHRLADRITDLEAHLIHSPQPVIARLSKELASLKRTLARQSQELLEQRQLNHLLVRRIRELEREVERGGAVARDSHNSSLPPSLDLPWQKVKCTRSLRQKSGRRPGGQHGHRGATLKQSERPDQVITHAPEACPDCGASLSEADVINSERRRVFDLPPVRVTVTEHRVVGADETGLRVAGSMGWIHVARTDDLTHFAYDTRRGRDAMQEVGILPQFKGTLVRDGYLSYSWFGQCRHSLCNAHRASATWSSSRRPMPRRKCGRSRSRRCSLRSKRPQRQRELRVKLSSASRPGTTSCAATTGWSGRPTGPNPHPPQDDGGDSPKKKRPLLPPQRRLVNRLLRRRDEVLRFMSDLSVPFDNNGTERDLRMVKLQPKIGGCFRTADGARSFCRVRSYLSTARKQGHSLLCSLERVLNGKPMALTTTTP